MLGEPASLDHVDDVVRAPYEADGVLVIAGAIPPVAQRAAAGAFGDLDAVLPPSLTRRAAAGARWEPWAIFGTVFTTAAINLDYASHYHLDTNDLPDGFSTVGAIAVGGDYEGGELVFPTLRLAVDLRPGDLCLFKAHELPHGNTPVRGPGRRLSIVAYARRQLCREAA